jgi:hypothetical protein
MSLDSAGLFSALQSHAMTLGLFERVNGHESMNAPGNGLTCAYWWVRVGPLPRGSGLASTSGVVVFTARIYAPNQLPQDSTDPLVLSATDALIAVYSGDFNLGGAIRNVDLLGESGTPLSAQAGWLPMDGTTYRTSDVTIPLVVNDLWTQTP